MVVCPGPGREGQNQEAVQSWLLTQAARDTWTPFLQLLGVRQTWATHSGWALTLMGRSSSGFLYRSHSIPMMARATHSQLKKLKKLMTEKMSLEKAYSRVMRHCKQREGAA